MKDTYKNEKKTRNRLKKDLKNLHKIKNLYSKYIKVQRLKQQSLGLESFGTNQARWLANIRQVDF